MPPPPDRAILRLLKDRTSCYCGELVNDLVAVAQSPNATCCDEG